MADPTKYDVGYSFDGFQATAPQRPLPAPQLDAELAGIETSIGQIVDAVKDIRRSDGRLQNGVVRTESLSAEIGSGLEPASPWETAKQYAVGATVSYEAKVYRCLTAHVSAADFATDVAYWDLVVDFATYINLITTGATDAFDAIGAAQTTGVAAVAAQQATSIAAVAAAAVVETASAVAAIEEAKVTAISEIAGASGGFIYGAGTPLDTVGDDGQSYVDTTNNRLFGPKLGGEWPLDYWDLGTTTEAAPTLPADAVMAIFAQDYESANRVIPNRVRPGSADDPLKVLTRSPRGCFVTSAVGGSLWSNTNFTATVNYANDIDGTQTATRLVSTGAGLGVLLYGSNISCVAGDYAIVVHAQSNSGSQSWEYSIDGSSWTGFTITTTMARQAFDLTLGSTTNVRIRIRPASGVTGDINVGKFYLWAGTAASAPADLAFGGDGFIGNTLGDTVDCTTERLALSSGQCVHYDLPSAMTGQEGTIIAITTRNVGTVNNGFRDTFLCDILGSGSDASFALKEEETTIFAMTATWASGTSPKATFSPDYNALGGYHAHGAIFDATSRQLWSDDTLLAFTQGVTNASKTIRHLQTGTNNGFARDHHIAAIMVWPRKLSGAEYRAALRYADYYLTGEGGAIARPTNILIAEGDSITVGPSNESYVKQSLGLFAEPVRVHNAALSGSVINGNPNTTLNLVTRVPLHLAAVPSASALTGRRVVMTFFFGANDVFHYYGSAAAWLAALEPEVASAKALGVITGVATILPQGTAVANYASHNTERATANATLATWVAAEKCDFIIDFGGDATMGPDAAANNLTLYSDGLHPTSGAHGTYLGPIYRAAVDPWLL